MSLEYGPVDGHSHRVGRNACERPVQTRLLPHVFTRLLNRTFGRLRHVLQLQIFYGHPSVILCDGMSRLKHEVATNVADTTIVVLNFRLQSSALVAGLPLIERARLAQLGKLLTSFLVADLLFDGLDIALEHRPVRERHRLANAQINADLAGTTRTVVGEIHLADVLRLVSPDIVSAACFAMIVGHVPRFPPLLRFTHALKTPESSPERGIVERASELKGLFEETILLIVHTKREFANVGRGLGAHRVILLHEVKVCAPYPLIK